MGTVRCTEDPHCTVCSVFKSFKKPFAPPVGADPRYVGSGEKPKTKKDAVNEAIEGLNTALAGFTDTLRRYDENRHAEAQATSIRIHCVTGELHDWRPVGFSVTTRARQPYLEREAEYACRCGETLHINGKRR